jgi:propanol-preferring alcohol dehydrogenase
MKAMVLKAPGQALAWSDVPMPAAGPSQLLIRVEACGVCRTDLHVVDGELTDARPDVIPGHEIVGIVMEAGSEAREFQPGQRVGVPWLGWTCGTCRYCRAGRENLCDAARFTGYTLDGGYAQYAVADHRFCFALPPRARPQTLAPWLCAGLIGYRALRAAGDARTIGIYGFGAAAHIVCQLAVHEGRQVFAFTREGDAGAQAFALTQGASWAGGSGAPAPEPLDAAIIFAPVGDLVPAALANVAKGGTVVCAGIHMSDIPRFPYALLWGERRIVSVANLTRKDGCEFIALAPKAHVLASVIEYPLVWANHALDDLRSGRITGAAVLVPPPAA